MSSTKEFRDYVLEQLSDLKDISCKYMMGEYLLYYQGVLFGGIYDDRLLVKINKNNSLYCMEEDIPYIGAKPMYLVCEIDNRKILNEIVLNTYNGLKKG